MTTVVETDGTDPTSSPSTLDGFRAFLAALAPADRLTPARAQVATLVTLPESDRQSWRDMLADEAKLPRTSFDKLMREAESRARDVLAAIAGSNMPPGGRPIAGSAGWCYVPGNRSTGTPGGPVYKARGATWEMVLDWSPAVLDVGESVGGAGRRFCLDVCGEVYPAVPAASLRTGDAWDEIAAAGTGTKSMRDLLLNIITTEAATLTPVKMLDATGWYTTKTGERFYAWPDGRTTPAGHVVQMPTAPASLRSAAAVPVPELPDADLRAAVADMHGRGAGHLFHLAKGARSFAHSLRPVRHGVAAIGEPGTAKTSCLWVERSLAIRAGWEPLTTKSLRSTSTSVLMAAHFERDMPTIFNDLAVNGDSPTSVREDARKLIESLFRPFANREESRGGLIPGANRVLQQRDEWHIQSPPSLSAQTKVLELFQASLLRRVFIGRHRRGDADLAWWEANTDAMADVLRTIGDRVVSMLAEVAEQGAETLGNYLDACDVIGLELLQPVADAMVPGWTETVLNDVVRSVGQHLGGSVMVADVLGIEPSDIIDADTLAWVGRSLAAQWAEINDAHEAADDLSTAVADVVRAGLKTRRVHVRSATGQMEACVPGHTEQEHGLIRKPGGGGFPDEFVGEGCALYYLPTRAAIAVRSAELHTVLAASRDPRIGRATVRTLPGKLLAGNVSIPSTGRYASTHDIEAGAINGRMILLPVALLFDVPGAEPVDQQPAVPEPRPVPDPVAVAEPLPEVGPVDQGAAEPVPTSPAPKRYGASARTQGREAAQRETLAEGIAAIDRGEAPRILAAFEGAYAPRLHGRDLYRRPELPGVAYATYVAAGHSWLREYVGDALVLDRSGAWISSASSVDIAHGGLTHTGPDIDDGRPGLYRVQVHPWHERDTMPHPLGSPNTDTVVVPAPTLKLLQQLADAGRWADATVLDSWTGEPARMWEWASEYVNGLRRHAIETYGRDSAEYNRVKVAFSQAIAMMQGTEKTGGTDRSDRDWKCGTHRPDIATTVQALSAATMWRTLDRARKLCPDLPPIAVRNVDELVIPAGALDILTAGKKPAIVIDPTGIRLGSFKVKAIEMGAEA